MARQQGAEINWAESITALNETVPFLTSLHIRNIAGGYIPTTLFKTIHEVHRISKMLHNPAPIYQCLPYRHHLLGAIDALLHQTRAFENCARTACIDHKDFFGNTDLSKQRDFHKMKWSFHHIALVVSDLSGKIDFISRAQRGANEMAAHGN